MRSPWQRACAPMNNFICYSQNCYSRRATEGPYFRFQFFPFRLSCLPSLPPPSLRFPLLSNIYHQQQQQQQQHQQQQQQTATATTPQQHRTRTPTQVRSTRNRNGQRRAQPTATASQQPAAHTKPELSRARCPPVAPPHPPARARGWPQTCGGRRRGSLALAFLARG